MLDECLLVFVQLPYLVDALVFRGQPLLLSVHLLQSNHSQVLDQSLLDLLEAEMVGIQLSTGCSQECTILDGW